MTAPIAIRQFIAIFGGGCVAKGAIYEEPLHGDQPHVAFIMGQSDYIVRCLRPSTFGGLTISLCPFMADTPDAALWAAGKLRERRHERSVVDAYARAREMKS